MHHLQRTLNSVAEVVEEKLKEVSGRTLEKLREMDPEVASSLNPVIPTADISEIVRKQKECGILFQNSPE